MTDAMIGYGSKFEVHNDDGEPGTWFELAEVKTIGVPNEEQEEADATHMQSPGRVRETIPTFINPGSIPLTQNWVPGSASDLFIIDWKADGSTKTCRITTPNGRVYVFPAFVSSYETPLENESVFVATLTLRVAGQVVADWANS